MPQIQFIEDAYINEVIKTAGPYNPSLNRTQGIKMRELIKLLRDRFEQEISLANQTLQSRLEKNMANGYAGLDNDGKLPSGLLPDNLLGNLRYNGVYDASSNTPTLPEASSSAGSYYIVNIAGSYSGIPYNVGDWIVSDGTFWSKVDNSDSVTTVFGRNGNVVANAGDYNTSQVSENPAALYFSNARVQSFSDGRYSLLGHSHLWAEISDRPTALSDFVNDIGTATTVFGRTGNIIAAAGDYNTSLVTEDPSALYFTNARVQAFSDARYASLTHSHNWDEINNRPTSLSQFINDIGTGSTTTVFGRSGNIIATLGDYNTALVTENPSALYFTNTRVQSFADGRYSLLGHGHSWSEIANRPTNLSQFVNDVLPASTVFGRAGNIIAQAGDYNTSLVTEDPSALYFTNTRVQSFADGRYSLLGHGHGWGEISGKPTNLSQFANDLGNYGNFAQSNGANAAGTWNINISGQAAGLGGYSFNPQVLDAADYIFGRNGNNQISLISQAGLRGFLGLGNLAYVNDDLSRYVQGDNVTRTAAKSSGNVNVALPSGFYDGDGSAGMPNSDWHHLINSRHVNQNVNYQMQIAGQFFTGNEFWIRTIQNDVDNGWKRITTDNRLGASAFVAETLQSITDRGYYTTNRMQINGGAGTGYNTSNLELLGGGRAPNLGFHWQSVVASSITIEPSGRIAIMNNPGTGYEDLVARNLAATNDVSGNQVYGNVFTTGSRIWTGFDSGVAGSVSASAWFRSSGASGWYNETYGGGIYMQDATYVRTHGGRQFYCDNNILTGGVYLGGNYGSGLVGVYNPSKYQMIFAMGGSYCSDMDGTSLANHYGIAWTHSNAGGQSIPGLSHQALFTIAGQTASAVGDGIWTRGSLTVGGGQSSSVINMGDSDEGTRVIHCNSNRIGFLTQGGAWGSYCNDDGSWSSDSNMYAAGSISAVGGFYDTSDVRLKDLVKQDLDVSSIKAISYKWKNTDDGKIHVGYSAQDVEACLPFAVHTDEKGEKSVRYNEVLVAKIDTLEKQIAELMRRIN